MSLIHLIFGGLTGATTSDNEPLYPLMVLNRRGELEDLARYRGQVVLVVNTASKCGFTRQYDALESLYKRYEGQGLVVLGFPSNDFAGQEPGSDGEIESFCRINHGVTFPLFPKAAVRGDSIQPVFSALTTKGPHDLRGQVRWNFEKFLIDREGRLVGRWRSWVSPAWGVFQRCVAKVVAESDELRR
jgi:glutathione peroxidase